MERFKIPMTMKKILSLEESEWLNDEVVNFYLQLVQERSNETGQLNVHIHNTFFFLETHGEQQVSIRKCSSLDEKDRSV